MSRVRWTSRMSCVAGDGVEAGPVGLRVEVHRVLARAACANHSCGTRVDEGVVVGEVDAGCSVVMAS